MDVLIDITDRYEQNAYKLLSIPKEGWIVHHSASANTSRSPEQELAHLDAIANYHLDKWGREFGYHAAVFDSGRSYLAGDYDTSRAHTAGRNDSGAYWNAVALGLVFIGDFREQDPTGVALEAAQQILTDSGLPVLGGHKDIKPGTECPGNWNLSDLEGRVPAQLSREEFLFNAFHAAFNTTGRYHRPYRITERGSEHILFIPKDY